MPYLPGSDVTDGHGVPVTANSVAVTEANTPVPSLAVAPWLIAILASLGKWIGDHFNDLIGVGEWFITWTAQQSQPGSITTNVDELIDVVGGPVNNQGTLMLELDHLATSDRLSLLDVIEAVPPAVTHYAKDNVAPDWWQAPPSDAWHQEITLQEPWGESGPIVRHDWVDYSMLMLGAIAGSSGLRLPKNPDFSVVLGSLFIAGPGTTWGMLALYAPPSINWTLWEPGQSLVNFLNAQDEYHTWSAVTPASIVGQAGYAWAQDTENPAIWIRCDVRECDLPFRSGKWVDMVAPATTGLVPPVWPGEDYATLGTPVAIDRHMTVDGPMDGVLVDITSVDPSKPFWTFDSFLSYRYAGHLMFLTDNGYAEAYQYLGNQSGIYTPKTMSRAGSCMLWTPALFSGTVTPWTVTT